MSLGWLLFALVLAERLVELPLARANLRWALERGGVEHDHAFTRWLIAFHVVFFAGWLAELTVRGGGLAVLPLVAFGAFLVLEGGRAWVVLTLGRRWNTRVVVIPGTPPVRGGPFRLLPHPNYLIVALELYAYPLLTGCWWTAGIAGTLNLFVLARRIRGEERALATSVGNSVTSR